jgi:hypothetical protein
MGSRSRQGRADYDTTCPSALNVVILWATMGCPVQGRLPSRFIETFLTDILSYSGSVAVTVVAQGMLLTELQPEHGPVDLVVRLLRAADYLNRLQGVVVKTASFDELLEVNERNRDSWKPLLSVFNPRVNSITPDSAFCLLGRNADGDVVAAQAARLFTWEGTNLHQEAESLRLFYRDPETSKRSGEACVVTASSARIVTGRVAFLGAVWYRPDYRKRMPTLVDLSVGPICALTIWRPDYFALVMVEELATRGLAPRFGHEPEWEIRVINNGSFGDARLALLQSSYDQTLTRFIQFMAKLDPQD